MKRLIPLLLALLLLCGCAGTPAADADATASTAADDTAAAPEPTPMVSMYDLRKAMEAAEPALPAMLSASSADADPAALFAYLSDLDYEKVEGFFLSYAEQGESYELAVVCLKDKADLSALTNSLKAHVADRVKIYENYAPEQVPRARDTEIVVCGRYAALIMCDAVSAVRDAFEQGVG